MTPASLGGRVVVVGVEQRASAVALGERGATVVVVGTDSDAVGAVVRDVATTGARVAAFVGDPSDPVDADALERDARRAVPRRSRWCRTSLTRGRRAGSLARRPEPRQSSPGRGRRSRESERWIGSASCDGPGGGSSAESSGSNAAG